MPESRLQRTREVYDDFVYPSWLEDELRLMERIRPIPTQDDGQTIIVKLPTRFRLDKKP